MLNEWAGQLSASDAFAAGIAVCGVSFAFVGLRLPQQRHYLLFAAGVLPFALWSGLPDLQPGSDVHLSPELGAWMLFILVGLSLLWTGLAQHYAGTDARLARRAIKGIWLANGCTAALIVLAHLIGWPLSRVAVVSLILLLVLPMVALGLRAARREHGVGHMLSALSLLLVPLTGIHEVMLQGQSAVVRDVVLLPFMAMCMAVLPAALIREHRRLASEIAMRERAEAQAQRINAGLQDRQRALAAALQAAQAGERARSRFLGVVSHEIHTPMAGITGNLDILARHTLPPQQRALLDAGLAASRLLQRLVDNLIMHTRLQDGQLRTAPVATPIFDRLQSTVDHWQVVTTGTQLRLQVHLPATRATLQVDEDKLLWIVNELLANAIKFTDQGAIELLAHLDHQGQPQLVIEVRDSGCGVPADRARSIFAAFEQGDTGAMETRPHGGAGLGLAIAAQLASCLGGQLVHGDCDGGGSSFRLTVPVAPVTAPDAAAAPGPRLARPASTDASGGRWGGKRVLLVDDNAVVRTMLSAMLKGMGVEPVVCHDAAGAIAQVRAHPFDAVLMDISMPGMSGLEATRLIRSLEAAGQVGTAERQLPIIGISAHAAQNPQMHWDAGMSAFLSKPITWAQLSEALDTALA